jgi:methionyl-tRNA synthetase
MLNPSYFITTAIPYVNSKPHIGHAQEFILADALARYYRAKGRQVVLQSGTDDNATKNVIAAKTAGVSPKEFVDNNAEKFRLLLEATNVQPDLFVRTSSEQHAKYVQSFIKSLDPTDVYKSTYSGLYCSGCEDFYQEQDLVDGLCPDHLKKPEHIEEENSFFRLSRYQKQIYELIDSGKIKITPSWKKKEVLNFINQGLADISLSRSALRTQGWGISFPDSPDQTVYVWIDALINYLSGNPQLWREDVYKVHVIGKNVWKFHAIYWPALLLSAGLPVPDEIVIHGFLTCEGVKISKSLGNGGDPFEIITRQGPDALRFYLLGVLHFDQDADFIEENLAAAYNSELANKWGNLVSRVLTLAKSVEWSANEPETIDVEFHELRKRAFEKIHRINLEINKLKPWELLKNGQLPALSGHVQCWSTELLTIARLLEPFTPEGAHKLDRFIQTKEENFTQLHPRR